MAAGIPQLREEQSGQRQGTEGLSDGLLASPHHLDLGTCP